VGKKINANQIHFEMHPVYGNKCFTNWTVDVWCNKMLDGQKFVSQYHDAITGMDSSQPASQPASFKSSTSIQQALRSLLTDGTNV